METDGRYCFCCKSSESSVGQTVSPQPQQMSYDSTPFEVSLGETMTMPFSNRTLYDVGE